MAIWLVLATAGLIVIGGAVTSHDAGMAVPRGWDTFGVWSLIAPLELWWDDPGTRLEHSHRLKGYVVGFSTAALLVAVLATQWRRKKAVWLAVGLSVFVIAQAILGILRVDEVSLVLAGIHGVTGQVFFALTIVMAAMLGRVWVERDQQQGPATATQPRASRRVPKLALLWLGLLFLQLCLGSAVRHGQASLAIPDWPLHYGQMLPPMSDDAVKAAVAALPESTQATMHKAMLGEAVTAWRVHLHFTHRAGAYLITAFGAAFLLWAWRRWRNSGLVAWPTGLVALLLVTQVILGVLTVLSGVGANLATLHQTVGALLLAASAWLAVRMKLVPTAMEDAVTADRLQKPNQRPSTRDDQSELPTGGLGATA